MQAVTEQQRNELQGILAKMRVPREISENLLDPSNIKKTYSAFVTSTRLLSRDQWVIDFATLKAQSIEDVGDDIRREVLGPAKAQLWKNPVSSRLDDAISEGQTEMGNTRRRVKRVSLDVEADDLYVLKAIADDQQASIGTLIRQAIKLYIEKKH